MNPPSPAFDSFDLAFEIAGLATRLVCAGLDEAARGRIAEHYAAFAIPQAAAAPVLVEVVVVPGEPFLPLGQPRWQVRTWNEDGRTHFVSHLEAGWFELRNGRGELTLRPGGNPENFLRVLYAWRCLEIGALLVHAGGVLRGEQGWVFFGPSGSGKTTTVSLSPQAQVLSDDLVILACESSPAAAQVIVHGVPFRGDLPEAPRLNACAPLAGLFALEKSDAHTVALLPWSEAVARLAASVPFVMSQAHSAGRVLSLCAEINRRVPARLLRFRRDPGFWSVIDERSA
jgi:hypothetical protein